ncbi:MAG: hypothetical protein AAF456_14375 [Planctomycetota bacterium]
MNRLFARLLVFIFSIAPALAIQAQENSPPSNALEEAQRISSLTGRPMFVVAGSST